MGTLSPNEECQSCAEFWDERKKPRKKLIRIGSTQNKKVSVLICPYCDGDRALELPKPKDE
jgi:hypothetical protein